ncbi:MAG TPA: polyprenyl synthetase family protein [Nitrospinota bacterium]|nr:polyprenyl synthetase family protein [Nitrospinota bacterium]
MQTCQATIKETIASMTFDETCALVREDMEKVEEVLSRSFQSDALLIPTITSYLNGAGGKRLRPMLLVLSSKISGYSNGNRHILNSCIVELIHAATLLHDDVVDEAHIRRGNPSANRKWGNEASVLVGDFLFSKSFLLLASEENSKITKSVSAASKELAEGEVLGLATKGNFDISEDEYMEIIYKKTASLISVSCRIGAIVGNASQEKERALADFGLKVGIAFQLVDDVLDYTGNQKSFGKTIGLDFQKKKMTLPLINLFQKAPAKEKKKIEELVLSNGDMSCRLKTLVDMMKHYDSINYALDKARNYVAEAKKELVVFDESPSLTAILSLADYVVSRDI